MLSARMRVSALASVLALGGLALAAAPAHAAGATITVNNDVAFTDEPLTASGTCAPDSRTAVVTVTQAGKTVAEEAVDVAANLSYTATLDLTGATTGLGTATVHCYVYADGASLGDGSTELFIVDGAGGDVQDIPVTVSPTRVVVGGMLSISATCPVGTTSAIVMAGNEDANDPFIDEEVTPAADGSVSVTARVPATGQVPAKPGAATAVVVCSDGSGFLPLAVGLTNFTVAPAAVAPAKTPTTRAASATPQLANTGSDTAPLTAIALALIAAGGVAIRIARRA